MDEICGAIAGKVWGSTRCIFRKNNTEIHRITIKKGGKCSKHKHEHKHNSFFLESGRLSIKIWKNEYDLCDETIMEPGDFTSVGPSEYHQFRGLEDSVAYEIYFVELDADDITRESIGSLNDS